MTTTEVPFERRKKEKQDNEKPPVPGEKRWRIMKNQFKDRNAFFVKSCYDLNCPNKEKLLLHEQQQHKKPLKDLPYRSPIDVKEKDATKIALGELNFEQMWRPSVCTLITNTGTQLKLQLTSPGTLKFKPAGDVSYSLSDVKFFWAFDNFGSCHMIDGKKYALEANFTFIYSYEITVTPDLLLKRLEIQKLYEELVNEEDEEAKATLDYLLEAREEEYDDLERSILEKRYFHSEAKEALSKRKPTKFTLEAKVMSGKDDYADNESYASDDEEEEIPSEETSTTSKINLNREIQFKVERALHELAARRFSPIYRDLQQKKSIASEDDVEAFLAGMKASQKSELEAPSVSTTMIKMTADDPPIDTTMFPTERDREKERMRRAKYQTEKAKRELQEQIDMMDWVRIHNAEILVKIAIMFEISEDAPYYNLFSFLPRVSEPFTRILVDGNLLMPFQEALESPDFYTYRGSRFLYQDQEVVWIVMKNPMPILNDQLWALRNLKNEFRKPMESTTTASMEALNGRKIYFNVPEKKPEPPTCPGKDRCMCELEAGTSWKAYKSI